MEKDQIITNFSNKIIGSQQDIDPECVELVNDHFWDLLSDDKPEYVIETNDNGISLTLLDNPSCYKVLSDWTKLVEKQKEPIEDTYTELDVLPGVVFKNLEIKNVDLPTECKFYEENFKLTFEYPTFEEFKKKLNNDLKPWVMLEDTLENYKLLKNNYLVLECDIRCRKLNNQQVSAMEEDNLDRIYEEFRQFSIRHFANKNL
jgi:hypothetical protein